MNDRSSAYLRCRRKFAIINAAVIKTTLFKVLIIKAISVVGPGLLYLLKDSIAVIILGDYTLSADRHEPVINTKYA